MKKVSMILALVLVLAISSIGLGASTTKNLSTSFTLVNLSATDATGSISYVKPDGTAWTGSTHVSFGPGQPDEIPANGGQLVVRQYSDTLTSGKGSVVISSNVALGSVVQILARAELNPPGTLPTSGAYVGFSAGASMWYVPLAQRRASTASGLSNTQIIVQNVGNTTLTNIDINLTASSGTPASLTKTIPSLAPGASYYYDLDDETGLNENWQGSAEVDAGTGNIVVVANTFNGANGLRTFEGFPAAAKGDKWAIPQFVSKLANGLNTPVTVQNLSGGTIPVGGLDLICTHKSDPAKNFTASNAAQVLDKASYSFNPVPAVTVPAGLPSNWEGACVLDANGDDVVVFVQVRKPNVDDSNGAYQAINMASTDTRVFFPLTAKRLTNGFATSITIQNLSNQQAVVKLIWTASSESGDPNDYSETGVIIPANGSIARNLRLVDGGPMPSNWQGTLQVIDDPVDATPARALGGYIMLTNYLNPAGDTYRVTLGLTQP